MTLKPLADVSAARWLTDSSLPWQRLVTFGPAGFEAYARLRFIADPAHDGQSEADAGAPESSWEDQLAAVLAVLTRHTRTPQQCYFCLWDGWGDHHSDESAGSKVLLPHRAYHLFQGAVGDVGVWGAENTKGGQRPTWEPAFVWPADQAWCVANDVDPHWAGIGASSSALALLLADPRMDVVRADPNDQQPAYR